MQKEFKILAILVLSIVFVTSCNTETHSNPVEPEKEAVTEEVVTITEESLSGEDLKHELIGSWSTNYKPGQVDLNEDGSYKECEFYNSASIDGETESCFEGSWLVDGDLVVVIIDSDTVKHSVTWVFDNVVHFGDELLHDEQELAWENGMTKL